MVHDVYEALSVAIRRNSLRLAKKVLHHPNSLIINDSWTDYILLIKALQRGCKRIIKLLLKHNCRVNKDSSTNFFHTPLYYAVRLGDYNIVAILLHKGALINGRDHNQETALCLAMRKKHFDMVQLMLASYFEQNNNMHDFNVNQHYIAYYIACLTNNETALNNFVIRGMSIKNLQSNRSWYKSDLTLHFAVNNDLIKLVDLLLKCGEKITTKNIEGLTPLHLAFRNYVQHSLHQCSAEKIIDLILMRHSDKTENAIDSEGLTHFHVACSRNNSKIVENFIRQGADVNKAIFDESRILPGYTPLHCAAHYKSTAVVPVLLKHDANINVVDKEGCTPLHVAAIAYGKANAFLLMNLYYASSGLNSNVKIMDFILAAHDETSRNSVNNSGLSHFHIACTRFNTDVIKNFIKQGVDVNIAVSLDSKVYRGYTPLHCAVKFRNVDVVKILLENNANINVLDPQGLTALHMAFVTSAKYYQRETSDKIINLILATHNEKSENSTTIDGLSHFHIACTRNDVSVVEGFIKRGVNVNAAISLDSKILCGCSPLHCAVKYNRASIVKLLLHYGSDVNSVDARRLKPLQVACELSYNKVYELVKDDINAFHKNEELSCQPSRSVLKRLIKIQPYGQCKNTGDWERNRYDQLEIIKLLLKHKNDLNASDKFNVQPLLFESYKEFKYTKIEEVIHAFVNRFTQNHIIDITLKEFLIRRKEIVKIFLDHDVDINLHDDRGYTMLHILASNLYEDVGVVETAELLLNKAANINARTNSGMTPLHVAIKNGYRRRDLVEVFLRHEADVNCIEFEKCSTPLHLACQYFSEEPVQYQTIISALITKGADVNAKDVSGMTPLYTACTSSAKAVAEILKYGADINTLDDKGKTVLHHILEVDRSSYTVMGCDLYCVIRDHIKKLKVLGFYVSSKIESFCAELERNYSNIFYDSVEYANRCCKEIEKIKSIKIDGYSSLYSMILKDSNKMAIYIKNDAFVNIVHSENFNKEFPLYGYLLKLQFKKGLERDTLLNPVKDVLAFFFKIELPDACSENIIKYFSNRQLKELLRIVSLIKVSLKKNMEAKMEKT